MTNETPSRRVAASQPLLPGLARKALKDLERPLKSIIDANRAIERWFLANGDPFHALPPALMADDLPTARRHAADTAVAEPTASLLGTFLGLADEIERRLTSVRIREDF